MAFAIIEAGGKQYKVAVGQKIKIEKLDLKEGDKLIFDKVLLTAEARGSNNARKNAEVKIGSPYLKDAQVEGKVLRQTRADKKIVFRYHSKTRYRKKRGHKQYYTEMEITKI